MPIKGQMTKCVHAGGCLDREVGGVTTPIHTSSAYLLKDGPDGVCYPRYFNIPTQKGVAEKIAALENGERGVAVSSGMAAVTATLFSFLKAGDHAVFQNDVYGGTYKFITSEMERLGISVTLVQDHDVAALAAAVRKETRLVYIETPANPLLNIVDIKATADLCRGKNLISVIDSTFGTPINQQPLSLGVDVVLHSATKYLAGHSDLCCGVIVSRNELMDLILDTAVNHGMVLSAHDCYQLERNMKTLGLRVRQQNQTAMLLAGFLEEHPRVEKVYYPGLPNHPGHEIAKQQMSGFGGMISIDLKGEHRTALEIVGKLRYFSHAVSLGGVESLACFPVLTSHAKMPESERNKLGITETLVRLSVGIEDAEDLMDDLRNALD